MNLRRVMAIFGKEVLQGPKDFMFIFALMIPVVLSLVLSLVFGTYFSNVSRLGITDEGSSQVSRLAADNKALIVKQYDPADDLQAAVARGTVEVDLVLPADFDQKLSANTRAKIKVYVWGRAVWITGW
jgi:ABC-2 type transport system permease protein